MCLLNRSDNMLINNQMQKQKEKPRNRGLVSLLKQRVKHGGKYSDMVRYGLFTCILGEIRNS